MGVARSDVAPAGYCCPEVDPSVLRNAVRVAAGAAADVYRGTLPLPPAAAAASPALLRERKAGANELLQGVDLEREKLAELETETEVALRRPRITSADALARFEREVALRARLRHPHVLPLLAVNTRPPHYATVSPWMHGGDLFDALHVRAVRFDFPRVLALATQIADALRYLHGDGVGVVHRDVKTANILLDRSLAAAQIADLDLAVPVDELAQQAASQNGRAMHRGPSNGRLAHMVGTLVYLAPEVLQGAPHGRPADVYAFAITLNEVAAGAVPYVDRELPVPELHTVLETRFNELALRQAIVRDHLRPVPAARVPGHFSAIIADAWQPDPQRRPSFAAIVQRLHAIASMGTPFLSQFTAAVFSGDHPGAADPSTATSSLQESPVTSDDDAQNSLADELKSVSINAPLPVWRKNPVEMEIDSCGAFVGRSLYARNPRVLADISSTSGGRGADRMEDRSFVHADLLGMPDTHLLAVFDGHGGAGCAQFAMEVLPSALYRAWTRPEASPVSALVRAFQDTDAAFLAMSPPLDQSGCTALAALVMDSSLYVANAGDCRCVLSFRDGSCRTLTKDHVAADPDERARIEGRGGRVDPFSGRVEGRLMVSRALGDRCVKRYVSATPDVSSVALTPAHDFFILASDGLWDVVSSSDAAALVRSTVRSPDLAAKRLALKAIELGSKDNITVIVALLGWNAEFETARGDR